MALKISRREKYMILFAGGFIFLSLIMQFLVFPMTDRRQSLKKALTSKTKMLENISVLKTEYDQVQQAAKLLEERFRKRPETFTLFSFLDRLAEESGIPKDKVVYIKPSKSDLKNSPYKLAQAEMKLQNLSTVQLKTYLYKLEVEKADNSVFIRKLSINQAGNDKGFIDVVLQAETLEKS